MTFHGSAPVLAHVQIVARCLVAFTLLACGDDPPRRDILGTEKNLYSMIGEELVVRDFFQDRLLEYFEANGYERLEQYREFDYANWYFAPRQR